MPKSSGNERLQVSTIPNFVHTAAYAMYLFLFDSESSSPPNVLRRQWEELPPSTSDTFRSVAKAIFDTGDSKNLGFRSEQIHAALCHLFSDDAETLLSKSLKREERLACFVELGSQLGVDLPNAMRGSSLVTLKRGPGRPRKIPSNAIDQPTTHQARKRARDESLDPRVTLDASRRNSMAADLPRVDSSRVGTSVLDPDYIENAWASLIFDLTTTRRRKRQRTD
ncbi:uncharacterized protein ARMOST_06538 [Armillaria ostoyae]|uniref:Uncharacterized protein n=1 Tax=Armillaria ostoyae TaxID=47428 RepID=A0A284R3C1_ARMOS|nr:uncharacterized protein ARMOST_06538 [Armillaria ostoyae]